MKYSSACLETKKNGGYRGQLKYKDESGKWRKVTKALKATGKRAAEKELDAWRAEMEAEAEREAEEAKNPHLFKAKGQTVEDYLLAYIEGRREGIERSTYNEYKRIAKYLRLEPGIADVPLKELTPDAVQGWVNGLSERFAPVSVRKALQLLRSAMNQAVERDVLAKSPTRTVTPPKKRRPKPNALTRDELARLLTYLDTDVAQKYAIGIRLALFTGMREGEVCGLRWRNVDTKHNLLKVVDAIGRDGGKSYLKEPKTDDSIRTVYFGEELSRQLRLRRASMRAACAAAGVDFTDDLFVVGAIDGSFMLGHYLWKKWHEAAVALDLKGTQGKLPTFHDLRHSYATIAISGHVDVKTVSNNMGHAKAEMTLNTYASVDPDAARRSAETVEQSILASAKPAEVLELEGTGTDGR